MNRTGRKLACVTNPAKHPLDRAAGCRPSPRRADSRLPESADPRRPCRAHRVRLIGSKSIPLAALRLRLHRVDGSIDHGSHGPYPRITWGLVGRAWMRASRRHSLGLLHLTTQFDQCLAAHFGANLGEELTLLFADMVSHILGGGRSPWLGIARPSDPYSPVPRGAI